MRFVPPSAAPAAVALGLLALTLVATPARAGNWPGWRGPTGVGYTDEKDLPLTWNHKTGENVLWKVPLKDRTGHSSPIVWGDRIFLTTAHDGGARVSMLAFNRTTGKQLWETFVPTKQGVEHVYQKNSRASATAIASSAER